MENYETYEGLLLTLKKQVKGADSEPKSQFRISGRYQVLDIRFIERWFDMCPQAVYKRDGDISAQDDFCDQYILKIYFPSAAQIQELNENGISEGVQFDYAVWRVIGRGMERKQKEGGENADYETLCSNFPCLTLAFINISKEMAGSGEDLLQSIGRCIVNAAKKSNVPMQKVHAGLFPSFGFCDYALLFLSEDAAGIRELLENLENESVPGKNVRAISDFYAVTGGRQECQGGFTVNKKCDGLQQEVDIVKYQRKFSNMIQELNKVADDFKKPKRAINAIQNLMTMFLELISSSHCFDFEVVIGDMFQALDENIRNNLDEISNLKSMGKDISAEISGKDLWEALGLFRDYVGNYLSDMHRSERFLVEGHIPVHQSIGSSTKLLLFYNSFITKVAKKLADMESGVETYTFLVTSGGTDVTEAYDLFAHMDPVKPANTTMAVLAIPEMSLYDIRGTMLRLMHECLHYCGERKRKERFGYVLGALSACSALHFCELEKKTIWDNFEDAVFFSLKHMFSPSDLHKLREKWKEEMEPVFSKKEQELRDFIEGIFKDTMQMDKCGADYYSRYLYEFIDEVAKTEVFTVPMHDKIENKDSAKLVRRLYADRQELRKEAASKLMDLLRGKPFCIPFSNAQIIMSAAEERACQAEAGNYDETEMRFLINRMEGFLFQDLLESDGKAEDVIQLRFDDLLDLIKVLFKECYADCIAVQILGADFTDLVMSIAYETWDLGRAFPDNLYEKMRRKVEKDLFITEESKFRQDVSDRAASWVANGYENPACGTQDDIDKLCGRFLDDSKMSSYDNLLQPVEEYLKECIGQFKGSASDDFKEEKEIFRLAAFHKPDDLEKLLNKVSKAWKDYAGEKEDAGR